MVPRGGVLFEFNVGNRSTNLAVPLNSPLFDLPRKAGEANQDRRETLLMIRKSLHYHGTEYRSRQLLLIAVGHGWHSPLVIPSVSYAKKKKKIVVPCTELETGRSELRMYFPLTSTRAWLSLGRIVAVCAPPLSSSTAVKHFFCANAMDSMPLSSCCLQFLLYYMDGWI
jgi:hypothetical protein